MTVVIKIPKTNTVTAATAKVAACTATAKATIQMTLQAQPPHQVSHNQAHTHAKWQLSESHHTHHTHHHHHHHHHPLRDTDSHHKHKETYSSGKAGKICLREMPMCVIIWLISSVLGSSVVKVYTLPSIVSASCNQSTNQSANESTHIISQLINQSVNGSDIVTRLFADLKVR